jgi:hypothetical protein
MIGAMITHGRLGQVKLVLGNLVYVAFAMFIARWATCRPTTVPSAEHACRSRPAGQASVRARLPATHIQVRDGPT